MLEIEIENNFVKAYFKYSRDIFVKLYMLRFQIRQSK